MPIFEYRCDDCQKEFEALVRASSQPVCPHCGGTRLSKLLSVFATGQSPSREPAFAGGPCGSCGHPDGPGACALQ